MRDSPGRTGITAEITVVGVGPGDPDLLTLKAREALQQAETVVGFKSVLVPVRRWITGDVLPMSYADQDRVLDDLASLAGQGRRCVVCVWGDVNVSARELIDRVRQRVDLVHLVPGISSVQVACIRLGLALEESLFITLHARAGHDTATRELLSALRGGERHVILLPRPWDLMPRQISQLLLDQGIEEGTPVQVLQRLTLPEEKVTPFTLASLAAGEEEFSDLSIMVFPKAGWAGLAS
jgi:cobalt-precorrin-7 (C5)-methyltransferase